MEIIQSMVDTALRGCLDQWGLPAEDLSGWLVEVPKRAQHGDYATNVAMVLAPKTRKAPMEIAGRLVDRLEDPHGYFERIEIKPPGFINFFLDRKVLLESIREALRLKVQYGRSRLGGGLPVQVEFVSANPTGPLHIGHGRGAALGDALSNILEAAGYRVSREYYINDAGRQMEILGRSIYLRYLDAIGCRVEFPEDHYQGAYIRALADEIRQRDGDRWKQAPVQEAIDHFARYGSEIILEGIRKDLEDFRVHHDVWFRESSLFESGRVQNVLKALRDRGLICERGNALWFRSTVFGDEKDRVVVRSDGRSTYLASDIAYHSDKFERGFCKVIDIWGADHHGYVPRMKGVVQALGRDPEDLRVLLVQMVNLLRDGSPVSMSTRAGEFTTLREVLEEVGVDAARYIFLMRSPESPLDFDLEVAKRQQRDNPVYYVQYAHARICSILREAQQRNVPIPGPDEADAALLSLPQEWELVKQVVQYPEVIKAIAKRLEPHRLTYFLDGLASAFHAYYNQGWLDKRARVIGRDAELTRARLLLVQALRVVFSNALDLLGVRAPEQM